MGGTRDSGSENLFAPLLLARRVAHAIRLHELVMHQVDGRLGREVAVAPPIGPGAPVVDGAAGRRRELSDQIDLGVGVFLPRRRRIGLLARNHALVGGCVRNAALGQHVFRQHRMEEHRAARRLGPEDLAVPRDVEAPRVAAAAAVLLERTAVRFESDDATVGAPNRLAAVARRDRAGAVAVRGVDPAVEPPAEVVDDGVRVEGAEPRVELRAPVGDVVAIGVSRYQMSGAEAAMTPVL